MDRYETLRLSDFCEVVGTDTSTVRSAIQRKALPFRDYTPGQDDEKTNSRRRYSVSDAFSWHLMTEIGLALGVASGRIAGELWRSFGIPGYVSERAITGKTSNYYLVIYAGPGTVEPALGNLTYGHQSFVFDDKDGTEIDRIRRDFPFVMIVHLDRVFDKFCEVAKFRGWDVHPYEGFAKNKGDQE